MYKYLKGYRKCQEIEKKKIMEGGSGQTSQLPSIKPSSESPTKENEKMSEQPRTNNFTVRTGLRRMEKCYRLELFLFDMMFNDTWYFSHFKSVVMDK